MSAKPIKPMLARETGVPFDNDDWIFEIKWDGYRAIGGKNDDGIFLYSRNGNDFLEKYPSVAKALHALPGNAIIDGEIIVLNEEGHPDFQLLQHYSENKFRPIQYQVFDLLNLDGTDITDQPLVSRKELLKEFLPQNDVIKYCDHVAGEGIAFFDLAKKSDLEGILAKKRDSEYFPGTRSHEWLKIKNHKSLEALVAGYTEPAGSRKYFGALILAEKTGEGYAYIGHTGTGFNTKSLRELYKVMQPLVTKKSPFTQEIKTNAPVTWLRPQLVCEVKYTEITKEGKVRHPVFLRLRDDKRAAQVQNESINATEMKKKKQIPLSKAAKTSAKPATSYTRKSTKTASEHEDKKVFAIGKNKVEITHPQKIYFPKEKITKGAIADYYQSVSKYILPYLKGRPESLLRHPNGIEQPPFFHKDAGEHAPSFVDTRAIFSESTDKDIDYIICNNAATLAYMNNLGCIEINPWHSTVDKPDYPDYFMIDIDPSEKNTFDQVVEVALAVKEVMDIAGAKCYCKTSGATGMHVYIPTAKQYNYDQVKDFANVICLMVNERLPNFTTLERNLKKRGNKKIYLDYLQNRRGQTLACVYSARPRPGATVSTPLKWEQVQKGISPHDFTIFNTLDRLEKEGDLFQGILKQGIDMQRCMERWEQQTA